MVSLTRINFDSRSNGMARITARIDSRQNLGPAAPTILDFFFKVTVILVP